VGAFSVETRLEPAAIQRALNALLPADVAVRDLRDADPDFDPRRWALRRWYRYTIDTGAVRDPLAARQAWYMNAALDHGAMQQAANAITGEHDFAACSGRVPPGRSTIRRIERAQWSHSGRCCIFDIEGNAFLPHMVRMLTGAMVRIGRGQLSLDHFTEQLLAAQQGTLGPAAPARGLALMRVWYDRGYLP
jgi:tRNA pseudouridine38-40 synthase